MIPKIIHQTWKTKELPRDVKNWHHKITELHPGWDVRLWTDEDNLTLVKEDFPHLLDIYRALEYNIMRADIIRYMYMTKFGGYYLDLDYELFVPFDMETSQPDLMLPVSSEEKGKIILGNSIFGSVPQHSFWKDILDDFQNYPPTKKFSNKFEVLKLTGPDFISKIYFRAPEKYNGYLVPKNVYHPDNTLVNKKNYNNILKNNGTRGIHHCEGSWLKENNSLLNLISRANSSIKRRFANLLK
jgi:mannosyltransferase OCH1-like enzyme